MATVAERPGIAQAIRERVIESLDPLCIRGIVAALVLWFPLGYGLAWAGEKWARAALGAIGGVCWYAGLIAAILVALRWVCAMISPRLGALLDREVGAYFLSPIAYLVIIGMVVITSINFWLLIAELSASRIEMAGEESPVVRFVAYNFLFWIGMLFMIPVITMRLLAEEKRSGTIEVLMTAPVTELQVVLAKYLASLLFFAVLITPTALALVVLRQKGGFAFDLWPVYAVYVGAFTIGAMFMSFGLFFSSLTRNQIVAAMLTFATLVLLFFVVVLQGAAERSVKFRDWLPVIKYVAVLPHLGELGKGAMDYKYLLFHVSVAVFMLFATVKVVEARKWK